MSSSFRLLEPVVLLRDLREAGLRAGDVGTIVMVRAPDAFEVEFADGSGRMVAMVALAPSDLRRVGPDETTAAGDTGLLRVLDAGERISDRYRGALRDLAE